MVHEVVLSLCFAGKPESTHGVKFLFDRIMRFIPFYYDVDNKAIIRNEWIDKLNSERINFEECSLKSKDGKSFLMQTIVNAKDDYYSIVLCQLVDLSSLSSLDFTELMNDKNFLFGALCDAKFSRLQSIKYPEMLKLFGGKIEDYKVIRDKLGEEVIDVSVNPGKVTYFSSFFLVPGKTMLFGRGFNSIIPLEYLEQFNGGKGSRFIESGLIIDLFENIEESDSPKNLDVQRSFNEYIGLDDLEVKYPRW